MSLLVLGEVVGFALTAFGLIRAYLGARDDVRLAREKGDRTLALWEQEGKDHKAVDSLPREEREAAGLALIERYERLHEENGYPRPAGYGESHIPGREAAFVFEQALRSARPDLLLAGVGLLISTIVSVLSLILPA